MNLVEWSGGRYVIISLDAFVVALLLTCLIASLLTAYRIRLIREIERTRGRREGVEIAKRITENVLERKRRELHDRDREA